MNPAQVEGDVLSSPAEPLLARGDGAERGPAIGPDDPAPPSAGWAYLSLASVVR